MHARSVCPGTFHRLSRPAVRAIPPQIRSLQGAGPNPELESELVGAGHARENVRFFMEVHGWEDKKKCVQGSSQAHPHCPLCPWDRPPWAL